MKYYTILLMLFLCSFQICPKKPLYLHVLDRTTAKLNQQLLEEDELICRGHGGELMDDISQVTEHYFSFKRCDLASARALGLAQVGKLLAAINNDPELRPYLHEYPFPPSKVDLSIAFIDRQGHDAQGDCIAYVHFLNGKVYYDKYNPQTNDLDDFWEETYDVALKLAADFSSEKPQI